MIPMIGFLQSFPVPILQQMGMALQSAFLILP